MKKLPDDFKINVLLHRSGVAACLRFHRLCRCCRNGVGRDYRHTLCRDYVCPIRHADGRLHGISGADRELVRQKGETDKCNSCPVCRWTTLAGQFRCDGIDTRDRANLLYPTRCRRIFLMR
ncbi:hypothetical protein NXV73_01995 [Bacteroides salyersiae]|nr:hypothetical protein [Bacteroides salyersiae]